jgi:hypothetical protein
MVTGELTAAEIFKLDTAVKIAPTRARALLRPPVSRSATHDAALPSRYIKAQVSKDVRGVYRPGLALARAEREYDGMRMQQTEIYDYARQLLEAHGDKAVAEAAQKARGFEVQGKSEDAETWRHIEAALKTMRGPHES